MKHLVITLAIIMIFVVGCSGKNGKNIAEPEESYTFTAMIGKSYESGFMAINVDKELSIGMFEPLSVGYEDNLELEIGDIVEIKFNGMIRESYPGQITASGVNVIEKAESGWPASAMVPEDYTYEEAIVDKNFVLGLGKMEGKDNLDSFISNSEQGIVSFLRVVAYTKEGDPIIKDILFDGKTYYAAHDSSRDAYAEIDNTIIKYEYKYMNTYEKDNKLVIYLSNRNDITNDEYEKSMESDREEDRIEQFIIYEVSNH